MTNRVVIVSTGSVGPLGSDYKKILQRGESGIVPLSDEMRNALPKLRSAPRSCAPAQIENEAGELELLDKERLECLVQEHCSNVTSTTDKGKEKRISDILHRELCIIAV